RSRRDRGRTDSDGVGRNRGPGSGSSVGFTPPSKADRSPRPRPVLRDGRDGGLARVGQISNSRDPTGRRWPFVEGVARLAVARGRAGGSAAGSAGPAQPHGSSARAVASLAGPPP